MTITRYPKFFINAADFCDQNKGTSRFAVIQSALIGQGRQADIVMPSLNWFSLNRPDGGAAYFWHYNRTSAPLYWNDWLYGVVITAAAFLTILVILSPAYKQRWMTLSLVRFF